jgi:hypothetical protein
MLRSTIHWARSKDGTGGATTKDPYNQHAINQPQASLSKDMNPDKEIITDCT